MAGPWQIHGTARSQAGGLRCSLDHLNFKSQTTQISHYFLPAVIYFSPDLRASGLLHLFPFVYLSFFHPYKKFIPSRERNTILINSVTIVFSLMMENRTQKQGWSLWVKGLPHVHCASQSEMCQFLKKVCLLKVLNRAFKYPERGIKGTLLFGNSKHCVCTCKFKLSV